MSSQSNTAPVVRVLSAALEQHPDALDTPAANVRKILPAGNVGGVMMRRYPFGNEHVDKTNCGSRGQSGADLQSEQ